MFIDSFMSEWFYLWKSKIFFILIALVALVSLYSGYAAVNNQQNSVRDLVALKAAYNNDKAFENDIKKGESGSVARQAMQDYQSTNAQLSPLGFSIYTLKSYGIGLLVLISGIMGIYFSNYDYKYRTFKRRMENEKISNILLGKNFSAALVALLVVLFSIFTNLAVSLFLVRFAHQFESYSVIQKGSFSLSEFMTVLGIVLLLNMVYACIWLNIELVLRRMTITVIIFLIYHLFVSLPWEFDFSNAISSIMIKTAKNVTYMGTLQGNSSLEVSWIVVIIYLTIFCILGTVIFSK